MPFAALALAALAVSPLCGSALRPETAKSAGLADAGLRATSLVEDLRSAVSSGAATSVAALEQTMTKITSPNDMEWTEDQKTILGQVITVIESMNEELRVSQNADQDALGDCFRGLGSMNDRLIYRLSDQGSVGHLLGTAVDSKADLADKVSDHEGKLADRNLRESQIGRVCAPGAGADQDSWAGFASDYSSKKDALEQWHDSFQAEREAHDLLEPARVLRDAHLCDWFVSMTTECSSFEAHFQGRTEACNENANAAQEHTDLRNEACKLGKKLSAKVKELLGEADESGDQALEENCFALSLPGVPARAECDPNKVMVEYELESDGWTSSQCAESDQPSTIHWKLGSAGENCDQTCSAGDEQCAGDQEWEGWPTSAAEVTEVARAAGLRCTSTSERCDMGEVPLFSNGQCYFCNVAGDNEWRKSYMPRCRNKWGDRTRICPCK